MTTHDQIAADAKAARERRIVEGHPDFHWPKSDVPLLAAHIDTLLGEVNEHSDARQLLATDLAALQDGKVVKTALAAGVQNRIADLEAQHAADQQRITELERWVSDLQDGMTVNCVYCGHRYGNTDEVRVSLADVLKQHVEKCPKHPLSAAVARIAELEETNRNNVACYQMQVAELEAEVRFFKDDQKRYTAEAAFDRMKRTELEAEVAVLKWSKGGRTGE